MPEAELILVVGEASPSLNETGRWHWGKQKSERRRWAELIIVAFAKHGRAERSAWRARMPFNRVEILRAGPGEFDAENLSGGLKHVVDILKPSGSKNLYGLGFIRDDRPSVCRITYDQEHGNRAQPYRTVFRFSQEQQT